MDSNQLILRNLIFIFRIKFKKNWRPTLSIRCLNFVVNNQTFFGVKIVIQILNILLHFNLRISHIFNFCLAWISNHPLFFFYFCILRTIYIFIIKIGNSITIFYRFKIIFKNFKMAFFKSYNSNIKSIWVSNIFFWDYNFLRI